MNFNPSFKQPPSTKQPFESKAYASDIVEVKYPENVLSSEIEKASDVSSYNNNYSPVESHIKGNFTVVIPIQ